MTQSLSLRVALALGLCATLTAGPASAQEGYAYPGGFYTTFGGGYEFVDLPELTTFSSSGSQFGAIDDEFERWVAELTLGYVDREGLALPDPFGENARIEVRVRYSEGDSSREEQVPLGAILTRTAIDGSGQQINTINGLASFNTKLRTWDVDLLYKTEVVLAELLTFTPTVGLSYSNSDFENDFKREQTLPFFTPAEINDEVTTHYYLGVLGGNLTARPADWIQFDLGARVDLGGATSDLDATQNLVAAIRFTESDGDDDFVVRGTATAGLGVNLGPVSLALEGYLRYLSYFPVADHPTNAFEGPSNIDDEDMWAAGGMARLTIWWP